MDTVATNAFTSKPARFALVFWATTFFLLLFYIYVAVLPRWEYLGLWYAGIEWYELALCYAIAVAPLFWIRKRIDRFSTFIHWVVYFFLYVPIVLIAPLQGLAEQKFALPLAIMAAFFLMLAVPRFPAFRRQRHLPNGEFWFVFWIMYVVLAGYVLWTFRGALALPSLYDVYEQRALSGGLSAGTFVGYATGQLSGCLNPFLMAYGLLKRRRSILLIGLLGQVFIFSTFAMKAVLLSALLVPVFHFFIFRTGDPRGWKMGAVAAASIVFPLFMMAVVDLETSQFVENLAALVYMRTYGLVGALTGVYQAFFESNPYTYLSHVNVVRLFVEYPYELSIGQEVGAFMGWGMNANANFFATDGLASAGLVGVALSGLALGFVLKAIDAFTPKANISLLCLASIPAAVSLANSSMFTTLLTGGLLLLVVLCRFRKPIT